MGASGWDYRAPYEGSLEGSLAAIQERVLASGDYIWPWEHMDPEYISEDELVPRPSTLLELAAAKEVEEFWDEGTHTILDVEAVRTSEGFGIITSLTTTELTDVFGTEHPSAADFDRIYRPGPSGPLADLLGERWSGRAMIIYTSERPAEIFFWGFSGD